MEAGRKREEESLGTTIMAIEFKGGVVLGADTRTSMGTYIFNRTAKKITKLADSIYCCRSGSAADTQAISDYVSAKVVEDALRYGVPPTVREVALLTRSILYSNRGLAAGMIVAGYDRDGPSVYSVSLGGSIVKMKCAIGGSGSIYISGMCAKSYREDMSREEAHKFVIESVSHAMHLDNSSGGCVRLMTICAEGEEELFVPGDRVQI
jgi:20S proteasome subunit beta 1